jgi:2-C-methyl-D-erythritol 4-phosphate cytidylyltransferase
VQTPQAFRAAALRQAFSGSSDAVRGATDCASLVEAAGFAVAAVNGEAGNEKITTPDDLARAEDRFE